MINTESPETLLHSDPEARIFFVLTNETVAVCKKVTDLPYHKQRSSYISAGVFSPGKRAVNFWGDAINPERCMDLLAESKNIDKGFTYVIAGGRRMIIDASPTKAGESNKQRMKAVTGITRKGIAGFSRMPAGGQGELKPQAGAAEDAARHVPQRDLSNGKEIVGRDESDVTLPTPRPKIEIRTGPNQQLQRQPVQKQVKPKQINT